MYMINSKESFKEFTKTKLWPGQKVNNKPKKFPCYISSVNDHPCDGVFLEFLYVEDLENMLTKLKGN